MTYEVIIRPPSGYGAGYLVLFRFGPNNEECWTMPTMEKALDSVRNCYRTVEEKPQCAPT